MLTETNHLKKGNIMHNIQIKTKVYTMSKTINLTAYEKKCACKLAHAFYDYDPEWQKDLPPFKEVLSVAKELIHHENTCEWRERLRREKGTPLMPGNGFDYVGVEYYLEKGTEYYGNLRESLKACMRSTYEALEGN